VIGFYVLTLTVLGAFPRWPCWLLGGVVLLLGTAIEIVQPWVGRQGSLEDTLADLAGITAAVLPCWIRDREGARNGAGAERGNA
jgi:VanZ family protein